MRSPPSCSDDSAEHEQVAYLVSREVGDDAAAHVERRGRGIAADQPGDDRRERS